MAAELRLRPIGCTPALSVTYSVATAAVAHIALYKCYDFTFIPFTVGRRSFPVAASILWNSLPPGIQSSSSLTDLYHSTKYMPVPQIISRRFAVTIHISTSLSWTS